MNRVFATATGILVAAAMITGCSDTNQTDITVFAAASLKSTFTELGKQFEQNNRGTHVKLGFAGSSDLVTQLIGGAPADVFASADTANMTKAVKANLVAGNPVNFAANTLTIVTPPGNPKGIRSLADLAKPDTQVVVCAPQVPCGTATKKIETATGTTLKPVSEEASVTDVLGKVVSGQADAGLVYVTDAAGAGATVTTVSFPESVDAVNIYSIAVLQGSKGGATVQKFVDLVAGPDGRKVLAAAGFTRP